MRDIKINSWRCHAFPACVPPAATALTSSPAPSQKQSRVPRGPVTADEIVTLLKERRDLRVAGKYQIKGGFSPVEEAAYVHLERVWEAGTRRVPKGIHLGMALHCAPGRVTRKGEPVKGDWRLKVEVEAQVGEQVEAAVRAAQEIKDAPAAQHPIFPPIPADEASLVGLLLAFERETTLDLRRCGRPLNATAPAPLRRKRKDLTRGGRLFGYFTDVVDVHGSAWLGGTVLETWNDELCCVM